MTEIHAALPLNLKKFDNVINDESISIKFI